jgi:hypothetical protein
VPREATPPQIAPVGSYLKAIRNQGQSLRRQFTDDPVGLAEKFHLKLPRKPVFVMIDLGIITEAEAKERFGDEDGEIKPGLRELVEDVCTGRVRSAVAVANRGGGKSQGVSFIETFLVFMLDYDALNLGGSELQADQVYQYIMGYIDMAEDFKTLVKGEALQSKTETTNNAWIRVLTASSKSVRSPHAGGRKKDGRLAGGVLVIDEEAEAAPEIVRAALPTINTARPSVSIRCSTFHNMEGTFAEVVDNAEEMGYKMYKWDIFDVCEGCSCPPDKCESEEKCFREDHIETFINPDTGQPEDRLLHKAYCGGRARYGQGWIPIEEIEVLWKRMKRNHDTWEVEAMGSRPSTAGFVIKDRRKYKANITTKTGADLYMPGWPVTVCVDWGTVAAGVTVWQEQPGDNHALLHADLVEEAGQSQILGAVLGYRLKYLAEFVEVAADIGGGGNYLNKSLREEHAVPCRDVNFGEDKESAVAAWNIFNESASISYPEEFEKFHEQIKKWKRKQGRIAKGNDHLMDSSICYFAKFIERLGVSHVRVPPRSFSTSGSPSRTEEAERQAIAPANRPSPVVTRVPIVRSFGRSR